MLKIIGAISSGGLPITFRSLVRLESEELLAGLVESLKAISKIIVGESKYRAVDYGKDKLLMLDTDNGYTLIALVSRGEEFMRRLLEVIADDVEKNIEEFSGLVTDTLQRKFDAIIDRYVGGIEKISDMDIAYILASTWEKLTSAINSTPELRKKLKNISAIVENERMRDYEYWIKIKKKTKGSFQDALKFVDGGLFDYACAVARRLRDKKAVILAAKSGIIATEMINQATPCLVELGELLNKLGEEDPVVELLKLKVKLKKEEISRKMYLEKHRELLGKIVLDNTIDGLVNAFALVGNELVGTDLLDDVLRIIKDKLRVPYILMRLMVEYNRLFDKLYSVTKYDEIRAEIEKLKHDVSSSRELVYEALKIKIPIRDLGKTYEAYRYGPRCFTHAAYLNLYVLALDILLSSPIPMLDERKNIAMEIIDLYFSDLRRIIDAGYPVWVTMYVDYIQSLASAIHIAYELGNHNERQKLMTILEDILSDILDIFAKNYDSIRPEITILTTLSAVSNFITYKQNKFSEKALLLSFIIIDSLSRQQLDRLRSTEPYNFASILGNILDTIVFLAPFILEKREKEGVMKTYISVISDIAKWMLSQGKVNRDYIINMAMVASEIVESYTEEELEDLIEFLLKLTKIAIPEPDKQEYEFAIVAEGLIELMIKASRRPKLGKYREMAIKYLKRTISILKKYGFTEKAKEIYDNISRIIKE